MTCPAHSLAATRRYLTERDVDDIQLLVRALPKDAQVVDLGAGSGTTALAVLTAHPTAHVYSVDNDQVQLDWTEINLHANGMTERWIGVCGAVGSEAVRATVKMFVGRSWVDLLLHDAGHTRQDVLRDLRAWLTMLRPGSYVWVHDFAPMEEAEESYPGVKQAIKELEHEGLIRWSFEPRGIGYVGRKL